MKTVIVVVRILLGLEFLVFGINGFYTFIPVPEPHPFMEILIASGFIYAVKGIEVVSGILLLVNRYVLLAVLILGPIVVNIALFHFLIDERNWPIAVVNLLLYSGLLVYYRKHFEIFLLKKI